MLKLYHFTPPANLPSIVQNGIYPYSREDNAHMLPGAVAVWLTSDPSGNAITEAWLAYWRKYDFDELLAQHAGGRRFVFGDSKDDGSARITVELPENFDGLFNYLALMRVSYEESDPQALAAIAGLPCTKNWWVVASPAEGKSFVGIGPGAISEVHPVGEATPAYLEAIEQISTFAEAAE